MTTTTPARPIQNAYAAGQLPRWAPLLILISSLVTFILIFLFIQAGQVDGEFNIVAAILFGVVLYGVVLVTVSRLVEGHRRAVDRLVTTLVTLAFVVALLPLISLLYTVAINGAARFDLDFFTLSLRNVVGEGGGAAHAIIGTLQMTLAATVISVPIGLMTSIYLVEYGRGRLAQAITFFVDVMTGIPSIVAGLFAYSLIVLFFGPGVRVGIAGALALSVLMIPVVVRSSEEMLRLVPNELREAAFALGVPKWLTILKVVLPTSIAGITTGVMLSIARVIGETAPLLVAAGFTNNFNYSLFSDRMQSLPVFVYSSYISQGTDAQAYIDRAWAGALTLILIVMALNLLARIIAKIFAPKTGR
ncbi:phosphate ABC transporter membrane protein 2 (PhoT family) [Salinibacterium amurskyense]|uniref:Phosphate transport system permease protein PstA n=1 Tax=Salinibacterium amurskyense TaxID=205941 RepID=A0A2M9D7M7_9MICO|nr:phosphate ABC transporter permease PstA [Salinibacterium amurskyense]PJJ81662.1 phosphate ABC transporter membrane protein 2 (PhoT family) [Salinibacterium amurskyense]RLQ83644.1 phosphate ABC transporter permease PstA [Salinibacterium amurskyense]GHD79726.1 phosphate transport system permease protein PstA [Salinibacterium amurskyense]